MAATQCLCFIIFLLITLKTYCIDASVVSNIIIKTHEDYNHKCNGTICIMKCCPDDLYVGFEEVDGEEEKVCLPNTNMSIYSSLNFDEVIIYNNKLKDTGKRLRNVFYLVESELLSFNFTDAYDLSSLLNYYLLEDGSLEQEQPNSYERWTHINIDKMCIDYVLPKSGMYEELAVKYFVILETPEMYETDIKFVASALLISCVFLVIVLVVYALLAELRNLCGLILMSYVASLFGAFLMLATLQLVTIAEENTDNVCFGLTITIYYFFLASFCWMNVMSFDIWWTFRGYAKARPIHRRGEGFKYGVYCAYSWGLPAVMTVFMVEIDSANLRHIPWFIQPNMISSGCFIEGGGKFVYLYVPMLTVIVINWMFFIMTAFNIWRLSRGTAVLDSPAAGNPSAHRTHRHRFMLYLKLSVIMGVSWVLEVVSFLVPQFSVWYLTDAYNLLIGVSIFLIFICKKKIYYKLRKRLRFSHPKWSPYSNSRSNSCSSDSDASQETTSAVCSNPTGITYYKR